MDKIELFKTQDGSLGLYNNEIGDVYHSKFGAYSESVDKFIVPANLSEFAKNNDKIRILDICYGIGYNTKSAVKYAYDANNNIKISIDAIDIDAELVLLSGLLKSECYDDYISYGICCQLFQQAEKFAHIFKQEFKNKYADFCDAKWLNTANEFFECYKNTPKFDLNAFLHNIYYHYVSNRNKKPLKPLKINDFIINWYIEDARTAIKKLSKGYDFIFLDAFTPKLVPFLWSYDFFVSLFNLLNDNGRLVTYSSAANIRGAMLAAGFAIGKTVDKQGKSIGTVACKKPVYDIIELNEFEKELLKTKAGLFYRDESLSLDAKTILDNLQNEKSISSRESTSAYMKRKGVKQNV